MVTPVRLLCFCGIALIVTSFSFVHEDDRRSTKARVTKAHIVSRIIPTVAVIGCCLVAVPKRQVQLIRELGRPPFVFWNWYALTATISGFAGGFASGLQPLWSAWKCFEVFVAMFFGATVAVFCRTEPDSRQLIKIFMAIYWLCYVVCVGALVVAFSSGIGMYVSGEERFQLEWPLINTINMSVIAAFALMGGLLGFRRLAIHWRIAMSLPLVGVLLLARSRTGLLALLLTTVYAVVCSRLSRSFRLVTVLIITAILALLVASPHMRSQFRLTNVDEIEKGSGRLEDYRGRSAWGECVRLIKESPLVGHGYLTLTRFIYEHKFTVGDNGALQALVAGGVIGATPAILYVFYMVWHWIFFALKVRVIPNEQDRILFGFGVAATCVSVTKALTTNSLSASDFALVLFILSVVASQSLGRQLSTAQRAASRSAIGSQKF